MKRAHALARPCPFISVLSVVLLLAACTPAPTATPLTAPTATALLSASPTITRATLPTVTAVPTSTNKHWQAPPVIIELTRFPGLSMSILETVPRLVLYADGRMIVTRLSYEKEIVEMYEARLSLNQICTFLNQIESDGFFDFNPNEYKPPRITDHNTTHIAVFAWRTQKVSAYAIDDAIYSDTSKTGAFVPPALARTYKRLWDYQPPASVSYQPERITLEISGPVNKTVDAPYWPLSSPTLAELATRATGDQKSGGRKFVVLENQMAAQVFGVFGKQWRGRIFNEDSKWYGLNVSPLLPLQTWVPERQYLPQPYSYSATPTIQLDCSIK